MAGLYNPHALYNQHKLYNAAGGITQSITCTGIADGAVGTPPLVYNLQIFPTAWDSATFGGTNVNTLVLGIHDGTFGTPVIFDFNSYLIELGGPNTASYGTPLVYNFDSFVFPHPGFDAAAIGAATIDFALRYLHPSGFTTSTFGTALCLGGTQTVHVTVGVRDGAFGTAFVSLGTRQVYPHWWVDTFYGATEAGYTRFLDLDSSSAGIDSAAFGALFVLDNRQYVAPAGGFDALGVGEFTFVAFATRRLAANPIEPDDEGKATAPTIYNLTRYLRADFFDEQWDLGGVCTGFMLVYNVNRVVDLVGNAIKPPNHQIADTHAIDNKARLLALAGQDSFTQGPDSFIAFKNREVDPIGWDGFTFGSFAIIYDAAALISSAGADASTISNGALVQNTRRYYDHIGLGDQTAFGTAYADYAIRTVRQEGSPIEDGGTIADTHIVWFAARDIDPITPWFPWEQFGTLALSHGFDHTLRPGGILVAPLVSPGAFVHNTTPQLRPYWNAEDAAPWGRPIVHHNPEYVTVDGWVDTAISTLNYIDYRTKHVFPPSVIGFRPNNLHSVRNVNPDPPGPLNIDFPTAGFQTSIGIPFLRANSLYPQGFTTPVLGHVTVISNGIFPKGIIPWYDDVVGGAFGIPTLPSKQYARPTGIHDGDIVTAPVMDPRTIWAPSGAPPEAHNGNPGGDELVDDFLNNPGFYTSEITSRRPWMNTHRVDLKNRIVRANTAGVTDDYGTPALSTRPIYTAPPGFKALKFGLAELSGGDHGLDVYNTGDESVFGVQRVTGILPSPWYFHVPSLGVLTLFPRQDCQNFNRSLPPAGIDADLYGTARLSRAPQLAEPAGASQTVFGGGGFIDYRVRSRQPEGDDMLLMIYELGFFDERLRAHGYDYVGGYWGHESTTLGETLLLGALEVLRDPRLLEPAGIAMVPIVPPPAATPLNVVQVASVGGPLETFGATWALPVTPGEIQPRGDDWTVVGVPNLAQQIYAEGWLDNAIVQELHIGPTTIINFYDAIGLAVDEHTGGLTGTHGVARGIGVSGFDAAQLPTPVAIAFGCGRQARALVGFDAGNFGLATVAG